MAAGKNPLPREEVSLFSRQLALVADSDVALQQGLAIIGERSSNRRIKKVCADVIESLNKGISFYDSIKKHESGLGSFFVEMAGIGEKSGNLPVMLERVSDSIDKQGETSQKIRSAVTYPFILGTLMLAVIVLLLVYVLPMFNDILTSLGGEMPGLTMGLMNFGIFISDNILWIIFILTFIALAFWLFKLTRAGREKTDYLKLHLPLFRKITRANAASRFARNLSMLIKSGVNITLAVEMLVSVIGNLHLAEKLKETVDDLEHGTRLEKAFEKLKLFPPLLIRLFSVAAETGQLEKTLEKAADIMEKETDERLERLTMVLEPVLIIFLSLLVGFILVSVILPVTGIMNAIG